MGSEGDKEASVKGKSLTVVEWVPNTEQEERSEEHTSELQSRQYLVWRLLLEEIRISGVLTAQVHRSRAIWFAVIDFTGQPLTARLLDGYVLAYALLAIDAVLSSQEHTSALQS